MVAVSVSLEPLIKDMDVLFRLIPVTVEVTVTVQLADFPPALAVMVAVPAPTALTVPPDTVATPVFEDVQVTLVDAEEGVMVAVSIPLEPVVKDMDVLFSLIPVTVAGIVIDLAVSS